MGRIQKNLPQTERSMAACGLGVKRLTARRILSLDGALV